MTTAGIPKQADCVHGRRAFDVNEYWLRRGKTYVSEERLASEYYRRQERFLLDRLLSARLPMQRILELGCGFGRITRLLASPTFARCEKIFILSTNLLPASCPPLIPNENTAPAP